MLPALIAVTCLLSRGVATCDSSSASCHDEVVEDVVEMLQFQEAREQKNCCGDALKYIELALCAATVYAGACSFLVSWGFENLGFCSVAEPGSGGDIA